MTRPIYQVKAEFFKVLGHPARIRVLEVLRDGERSVGDLIREIGLEPSHMSQQLGVLRRASIIEARRSGATVLYSVTDKRIFDLLSVAREILTETLAGNSQLLAELQAMDFGDSDRPRRRSNTA
ncbi:MAG TPA: metalloregulator ArsR/SmtB family transcription factor [Acidimicrobiia bacterium]|nr:metalloregulator ArsR/SmtB family transcription factor [Acidimicrobiia bacterium]